MVEKRLLFLHSSFFFLSQNSAFSIFDSCLLSFWRQVGETDLDKCTNTIRKE
jgi:hypothetical protein